MQEAEQHIKLLKRLYAKAKAYSFNTFARGTGGQAQITKPLGALGIRRTLVYHGLNTVENYEPVGLAIGRIALSIEERLEGMRRRQAA